ncbi:MAG: ABC transporter six-transmembrane domain-containing protein [Alphaproteobacteria bacterium]|nr:ABC transporter six-transmembrane domain-containing protein [Alphaproteobacteria bacterium]MBU0794361.1 ABC transporter six-transmembrane domain-containing protein [Alphaproteobacteria bacterium]MBU0875228.1 ABC transporter six-transmembrane domain-containing protein [Alphaproteobacteria bacterium]MBU1768977.1 ABC transporter six-transmembrane domain-containing protein [Alphaproteobacteria bacterium]
MSAWAFLLGIGGRHKPALAFTYGLTLTENVAVLLYPAMIGRAIDGLLADDRSELVVLAAVMASHLAIGIGRHMFDTRVFSRIYADLAGDMVLRQRAGGASVEQVAARVLLSREIIDFWQSEVPAIATALVSFIGAVMLLPLLSIPVGVAAIATLLPIAGANWWFAHRSLRLNRALNDVLEREVAVVATAPPRRVHGHFARLTRWRVRVSDAEAATWGIVELATIGLVIAALLILAEVPGATVGTIFAVLGYVLAFGDAIDDLPNIVQNIARVRDIVGRVRSIS